MDGITPKVLLVSNPNHVISRTQTPGTLNSESNSNITDWDQIIAQSQNVNLSKIAKNISELETNPSQTMFTTGEEWENNDNLLNPKICFVKTPSIHELKSSNMHKGFL